MASFMRPILRTSPLVARSTKWPSSTALSLSRRAPARALTSSILRSSRRPLAAGFHTTSRRSILPPGPQVIEGTTNDAAPVPPASPSHGSYHWTFERAISVGLIPLTIAPFAYGSLNPALDAVFVASILLHSHIGFTSMITDYIPTKQHPTLRKTFEWLLKLATVVVGIGFYEFETNDVGLTEAVKRIWRAGSVKRDV